MSKVKQEFADACINGKFDIIESIVKLGGDLFEKGSDHWNDGLYFACRGGHFHIVKFMIANGANDWNSGLIGACFRGHLHIADSMIEKGATKFNEALYHAHRRGHLHIVKRLIDLGASVTYHLSAKEAYQLLEMGQSIQTFTNNEKFQELIKNIQSFREKILCATNHYFISDLSSIVANYSLN